MPAEKAWIGLGGNLRGTRQRLAEALERLDGMDEIEVGAVSSLYRTPPWGDTDQPDFLNAVAQLRTPLAPRPLLERLLATERTLGRQREKGRRWGPRVIDLDLLLHGVGRYKDDVVEVPHPRLHERAFALAPLAELDEELAIPGRGTVRDCLASLGRAGVVGDALHQEAGPGWATA